ncbi:MAG: T9SS type A sorting domain-containing protein [Bacteroidales bacterium]|nr:T9SS type A sorting domain-containing protein [Bacteroidales bacterium]
MKRFAATIMACLIAMAAFSQFTFSGGNGEEDTPYIISTLQDLKDFRLATTDANEDINSYYRHSNYILSNDISIPNAEIGEIRASAFYGHFNGKGHSLVFIADDSSESTNGNEDERTLIHNLGGTIDSVVMTGEIYNNFYLINEILESGKISNCINYSYSQLSPIWSDNILTGFVSARFADANYGIIENCINYADIYASSICGGAICQSCWAGGIVRNCKNYGNIYNAVVAGGICTIVVGDDVRNALIENCINYGNIYTRNQNEIAQLMSMNQYEDFSVGGIFAYAESSNVTIRNCQNYGTIVSEKFHTVGGIYGGNRYYPNQADVSIENCANYGKLYNGGLIGGIVGNVFGTVNVSNCYNAGEIQGYGNILASENALGAEVRNCLSVYGGSNMVRAVNGDNVTMSSNYYDKQMVRDTIEDIIGQAEGRLTMQLTGDTPELRAMLGDGWSYAEGRYPIPLGLENDSLAMLFATPIYLYGESNASYGNLNLVQYDFTVGIENEVTWSSDDLLVITDENATILASGIDTVTVSLAGYSFSRTMNLIDQCGVVSSFNASACDNYQWNDVEYTTSGDYMQMLTATNGCDSIVTLHLTINNPVHYSFTESATSPYVWNGTEYTETGDYVQNFTAQNGCDSIVTLHLNILSGIPDTDNSAITIFPNPTNDILNITSSETISEIEIINALGQVVLRKEINADNAVCDVNGLTAGVYVVKVRSLRCAEPAEASLSKGAVVEQRKFIKE